MMNTRMRAACRLALAGLALLLAGCETVVDVDLPSRPPRLVVNGFFTPDSLWEVHVSGSVGLTRNDVAPEIEDATVEVWEGAERRTVLARTTRQFPPYRPLFEQYGYYQSTTLKPEAGRTYTLRVSAPGYEPVEVTNQAPPPARVSGHTFRDSVAQVQYGSFSPISVGEYRVQIEDPAGEENYYIILVSGSPFSINPEIQDAFYFQEYDDDPFDVNRPPGASTLPLGRSIVFDDSFFEGQAYEVVIRFETEALQDFGRAGPVQVVLASTTEALFRYEQTRKLHKSVRENPFAEPVAVYTNVQNGVGIFAGYTAMFSERHLQRSR
jgi:hypothetical protein